MVQRREPIKKILNDSIWMNQSESIDLFQIEENSLKKFKEKKIHSI